MGEERWEAENEARKRRGTQDGERNERMRKLMVQEQ